MLIVAVVFEFVPGGFDRCKDSIMNAIEKLAQRTRCTDL